MEQGGQYKDSEAESIQKNDDLKSEKSDCLYRINKGDGSRRLVRKSSLMRGYIDECIEKLIRMVRRENWEKVKFELSFAARYSRDYWNAIHARLPSALAKADVSDSAFVRAKEVFESIQEAYFPSTFEESMKLHEIWSIARECLERRNQGYLEYDFVGWDCKVRYLKWCRRLFSYCEGEWRVYWGVSDGVVRGFEHSVNPHLLLDELKLIYWSRLMDGPSVGWGGNELPIVKRPSFALIPPYAEFEKLPVECKIVKLLWEQASELSAINAANEVFPNDLVPGCNVYNRPCSRSITSLSYYYNCCIVEVVYKLGFVAWYYDVPAEVVEKWLVMTDAEQADNYLFECVLSQYEAWYHLEQVCYWPEVQGRGALQNSELPSCLPVAIAEHCEGVLQKLGARVEILDEKSGAADSCYDMDGDGGVCVKIEQQDDPYVFVVLMLRVLALVVAPVPVFPEISVRGGANRPMVSHGKWWKLTFASLLSDMYWHFPEGVRERIREIVIDPNREFNSKVFERKQPQEGFDKLQQRISKVESCTSGGQTVSCRCETEGAEILREEGENIGREKKNKDRSAIERPSRGLDSEFLRRRMLYEHLASIDASKEANGDSPSPFNGWCSDLAYPRVRTSDDMETYEPDGGSVLPSQRFYGED